MPEWYTGITLIPETDDVPEQPDYVSYLLRLWRENGEGSTNWRASIESALTGKRHVFPGLTELFAFLQRQTVARHDADEDEGATGQRSAAALE